MFDPSVVENRINKRLSQLQNSPNKLASLHDSQVAIPLAEKTNDRVCSLYDLMDAAYDAPSIPHDSITTIFIQSIELKRLHSRDVMGSLALKIKKMRRNEIFQ